MAQNYGSLSRAQLSFEYLHTNSTTHEFLFGALAELVDNARDASATRMDIYTVNKDKLRGGYMLCFLDNGEGMDPNETADIVTFGRSTKRSLELQQIGMYGNGLKSGSMRIGNDLILFTKKDSAMSCLFLSRTFHEEENIDEVIVPIPSFDVETKEPLIKGQKQREKYDTEMELLLKYSPFQTEDELLAQFDKIEGKSGTLVIVYNLKLLDTGDPELDITTDPTDIILANPSEDFDSDEGETYSYKLMPEKRSFRAYTSILYMDPRMKIYLQSQKVRTKKLACSLYKSKYYKYASSRFKARSENETKKAKEEASAAEHKAREAESKATHLENKYSGSLSKDQRTELRKVQHYAAECRREAETKRQLAERKNRALKEPKTLNLIFGINLENRSHDGVFVYNCSRLIKMYEKVGPQTEGGVNCSGVVGVVDVPYLVLEPTHNKQDFADAKEYRHLLKAMGEHMVQYWKDIGIAQQGVTQFWENFGYISQKWKDPPSDDNKFVRKRAMQINVTLQCDLCLKWRTLPFSSNNIGKKFEDDWICSSNPDAQHNKCTSAEQKMNIPEGVLKKESKNQEQKQKDLEEEIKKKQEMLEKMNKTKAVTSSRQVAEMERKKKEEEMEKKKKEEEMEKKKKEEQKRKERERVEKERLERERKEREKEKRLREEKERRLKEEKARQEKLRQARILASKKKKRSPSPPPAKKSAPVKTKPAPIRSPTVTSTPRNDTRPKSKSTPSHVSTTKPSPIKADRNSQSTDDEKVEVNSKSDTAKRRVSTISTADSESEIPNKRNKSSSIDSDSDTYVPSKKSKSVSMDSDVELTNNKRGRRNSSTKAESSTEDEETNISMDTSMEVEPSRVSYNDADSNGEIGTKVEGLVNNKWYSGAVVKVGTIDGKWKVKFDHNPKDKYDKWFDKSSPDIRLKSGKPIPESPIQGPPSPASISSHDTAAEAPSSSTTTPATPMPSSQITEEIANGYRTCLRYFLPPQWIMDKDAISAMSIQELASFPLDDFFDHYEQGLRKLVGNFQTEASQRKDESDAATTKLSSVRKLIAKLLKSINEEFDIDPEADGDQVDELLAACVKQAVQSQP